MASLEDARAVVEEGGCTNWGQLPDFTHKTDKFGLGFTTGAQRDVRRARAGGPPLHISNRGIMPLKTVRKTHTLIDGSTQLPTMDRVTGRLGTLYQFLLFRNN